MEKMMMVAYMMENGFTFLGLDMDTICERFTMEELETMMALAMGEDPRD